MNITKRILIIIILIGIIATACNTAPKEDTNTEQNNAKPFTSTHVFVAEFEGIEFHTCMGMTALCPDQCGHSGNMAKFKIIEYKELNINGLAGTEKLDTYEVLISDYHKNDLNKDYVADIKSLQVGDEVTIHIDFVYDTTKTTVETVENIINITKNIADGHSSKTSVDWAGSYEGNLPCADCESIKVIISLKDDNTYTKTETYYKNGKESKFESKGSFEWDASGNIISLKSQNATDKYQVGENKLFHLDIDGKRIKGELANMYILRKKS